MSATPFLTRQVSNRKDVLLLRHQARQVAGLLRFSVAEQACIAAGTFAVAWDAVREYGCCQVSFRIDQDHLHVFAQGPRSSPSEADSSEPARQLQKGETERTGPCRLRLAKPLPREQGLAEMDVAWLVSQLDANLPVSLYDEVARQNQEMLSLLHELRVCQGHLRNQPAQPEEKPNSTSAA